MTFISYAQNFEDVMLHRALCHVEHGRYVDVGAQDPVADSVTRAFYERGWRGMNIEPVDQWHRRLEEDRPEDLNLPVAVSSSSGSKRFYEVHDTGLSTLDPAVAERHRQQGYEVRAHDVVTRTFDSILEEHGLEKIHFLKVDVEGAEAAVLRSIDLTRTRPWIVVVEATEPNTQVASYRAWQPLLTRNGYRHVYSDGPNRFSVPEESPALQGPSRLAASVFDHFAA